MKIYEDKILFGTIEDYVVMPIPYRNLSLAIENSNVALQESYLAYKPKKLLIRIESDLYVIENFA